MSDIGPGDLVVCVAQQKSPFLRDGRAYRVHAAILGEWGTRDKRATSFATGGAVARQRLWAADSLLSDPLPQDRRSRRAVHPDCPRLSEGQSQGVHEMKGDISCVEGRLWRHDPQPDDPYLETDIGQCPDCSGDGCGNDNEGVSKPRAYGRLPRL